MILYATSRKGQDLGFIPSSSNTVFRYPRLDIADSSSIQNFAETVKNDSGAVDVLINNAGVNLDPQYSAANAQVTLDVNYRGTLQVSIRYIGNADLSVKMISML